MKYLCSIFQQYPQNSNAASDTVRLIESDLGRLFRRINVFVKCTVCSVLFLLNRGAEL
jgi:hypothetical protein